LLRGLQLCLRCPLAERKAGAGQLCDEARALAANVDEFWRASITEYLNLRDKLHEICQTGLVGRRGISSNLPAAAS